PGRGEVKDRVTGLQVGADEYLVKPFDRDEVLKRVRILLERRPHGDAVGVSEQTTRSVLETFLTDRATGLPSVPMLLDRLKETLIEQGEIGIVFVDIEQFEAIEAEYGWAFFDELLRRPGEIVMTDARARCST